jgi:hypothetical protein
MDEQLRKGLDQVARFYDDRKVGDLGSLGFRRSTDLMKMTACLDCLVDQGIIVPGQTRFLDMGCADGRVNVFLSYLVRISVGIELDEWTLDEYAPLKAELTKILIRDGLLRPPENIALFHGDSTDKAIHEQIFQETGWGFESFDLFYTYLVMHEEFAELITERAREGAYFMVYGVNKILPRYGGLRLLDTISPMEGVLAVYQKRGQKRG